jgi:hypothetical protein
VDLANPGPIGEKNGMLADPRVIGAPVQNLDPTATMRRIERPDQAENSERSVGDARTARFASRAKTEKFVRRAKAVRLAKTECREILVNRAICRTIARTETITAIEVFRGTGMMRMSAAKRREETPTGSRVGDADADAGVEDEVGGTVRARRRNESRRSARPNRPMWTTF